MTRTIRMMLVAILVVAWSALSPVSPLAAPAPDAPGAAKQNNKPVQPARGKTVPPAPATAPTGLAVTSINGQVNLTWASVGGASGYRIFRSTTSTWTAPPIGDSHRATYRDRTATTGVNYAYRVAAFNRSGNGPMSEPISITPTAPPAAPTGLAAAPGNAVVTLTWNGVSGATSYKVFRGTTSNGQSSTPIADGVTTPSFANTGLANGTTYFYKVSAMGVGGESQKSSEASGTPLAPPAPLAAPTGVMATPGNAMVTLSWTPVAGATSYSVYRGTSSGGEGLTPIATGILTSAHVDSPLTNGVTYFYQVTAVRSGEQSPRSPEASTTPLAPVPAPTGVSATPGNATVSLTWLPVPDATSYNVYRGTSAGGENPAPLASGVLSPAFTDNSVTNGVTYFYQVTALRVANQSGRSAEVFATPTAPPPVTNSTLETFRFLRQAAWGARPGDVAALAPLGAAGRDAFITQQLSAPASSYPDILFGVELEVAQEHFMSLTLTGQDQLRQRMAWALHKIWVASATEVPDSKAIVTYQRIFLNGAFGNYRDLMFNVTVNPAMGKYLNMLNNKSVAKTGFAANENYARELMQLFTLGLTQINPDGTPTNPAAPVPTYTEDDVKALARILTGWTYGDGLPGTTPNGTGSQNYGVPMEAVTVAAGWHDVTAKHFLGEDFAAGGTALVELNRALDIIFNQTSLAPFVSRQLIQQLVTSNPSPAYVQAVTAVFNDNGGGVRGDLAAVVRAILTHPEALASTAPNTTGGKLSEPVLFISSTMRALNATVSDHPFMTDRSEVMGQRVFYPPSVFSYFSPGFRVRGTNNGLGVPLAGPEFQGLTTVTALERANFIGALLRGDFNSWVTIDYSPFTTKATDINQLVDFVVETFLGGRISPQHRSAVVSGVTASGTDPFERTRTAIYLTLTTAQAQVDR